MKDTRKHAREGGSGVPPAEVVPDSSCLMTFDASEIAEKYADMLCDESQLRASGAGSIALPKSIEQLVWVMSEHHRASRSVVLSGSRTGLVGGAVPMGGEHVVSLSRLVGIVDLGVVRGERRVRVGAGVTLQQVADWARDEASGWFYPVDPTERSASFGGMVATNAAGSRARAYGRTRDWVRGLRVVLADGAVLRLSTDGAPQGRAQSGDVTDGAALRALLGQIMRAGSPRQPACKRALGYELRAGDGPEAMPAPADAHAMDPVQNPVMNPVLDAIVGSEGTLAAICDVEIALAPEPESHAGYLQLFSSEASAHAFVRWLHEHRSVLGTLAVEWLDARALALGCEATHEINAVRAMVTHEVVAAVYAEFSVGDRARITGYGRCDAGSSLDGILSQIVEYISKLGEDGERSAAFTEYRAAPRGDAPSADARAAGAGCAGAIKEFRRAVPERINALIAARGVEHPSVHKIATDMAVPDGQLLNVLRAHQTTLDALGLDYAVFGHIGSNHLHVNILPRNAEEMRAAAAAYVELAKQAVAMGGAVSAEHGLGRIKRHLLALQFDAATLARLWEIKRAFDPHCRLNPNILLPSQIDRL